MTHYTLMVHYVHRNGQIVPSVDEPNHPDYKNVGEVEINSDGSLIIHSFKQTYDPFYGYTLPVEFFQLHADLEVLRTWLLSRATCNSFDEWIASASNCRRVTG